jgi:hypothetical protein
MPSLGLSLIEAPWFLIFYFLARNMMNRKTKKETIKEKRKKV